jgi:isopentenyl-diphosphate delta-isomerase
VRELGVKVTSLRLVLPRFAYRAEMDGVVELEQCPVYAGRLAPGAEPLPASDEVCLGDVGVLYHEQLARPRIGP